MNEENKTPIFDKEKIKKEFINHIIKNHFFKFLFHDFFELDLSKIMNFTMFFLCAGIFAFCGAIFIALITMLLIILLKVDLALIFSEKALGFLSFNFFNLFVCVFLKIYLSINLFKKENNFVSFLKFSKGMFLWSRKGTIYSEECLEGCAKIMVKYIEEEKTQTILERNKNKKLAYIEIVEDFINKLMFEKEKMELNKEKLIYQKFVHELKNK